VERKPPKKKPITNQVSKKCGGVIFGKVLRGVKDHQKRPGGTPEKKTVMEKENGSRKNTGPVRDAKHI